MGVRPCLSGSGGGAFGGLGIWAYKFTISLHDRGTSSRRRLWPEVPSRPVVVTVHEDASRTSPEPETSSDHQGRCAWTHRSPFPVPVALECASLPSSPRRAARVLCASLPSRCSPILPLDHGAYRGAPGVVEEGGIYMVSSCRCLRSSPVSPRAPASRSAMPRLPGLANRRHPPSVGATNHYAKSSVMARHSGTPALRRLLTSIAK